MRYTNLVWMKFIKLEIIQDLWMVNWKRFVLCRNIDTDEIKKVNFYDMKNGKINWFWKWQNHRRTHSMSKTRIYCIYKAVKKRCSNHNDSHFKYYGWRWIKCEWDSFEEFYDDMGNSYADRMSIERINVNWNYCKENCKWIPLSEQSKNRTTTRYLEFKWKRMSVSDWAKEIWIKRSTLSNRINAYGWDIEKALT